MRGAVVSLLLSLGALLVAACSPDPAVLTKADERALGAQMFETLERARSEGSEFPVPVASGLTPGAYRRIAGDLPRGEPVLVGAHRFANPARSFSVLTYAIEGEGRSALVSLQMTGSGRDLRVNNVNIQQLSRPLSELKGFRADEAGPGKLLLLLFPLAAVAIALAGIARVWRSGRFGRRWLWTLGCLLGLFELRILWPSGRVLFQPGYISILPAGFRQIGPVPDGWLIAASIPVVAIVALLIRRGEPPVPNNDEAPSHP